MAYFRGTPGRVLDVGCGVGNFLALAKEKGWECWGIDFDQDAIEAGKKTFGLEHLEVADLAQFAQVHPGIRFDLITFFDVFEHIDAHREFLLQVRTLLAPGGHIALSVPYRHGWRWLLPHDLPPRHLTRWDEKSLTNILARHDFSIRRVWRLPASLYFLVMKFRFRYGAWTSLGLVRKIKKEGMQAGVGTTPKTSSKVRVISFLAKAKDVLLFGLPALVVWLVLLPTRARYTDLYVVAKAN